MSPTNTWRDHPEQSDLRRFLFQIHLWTGMLSGVYVFVMSVTGAVIVCRDRMLERRFSVEPLVTLHTTWIEKSAGHVVNGVGAVCLILLCLTGGVIWWPGLAHWRRSLTVEWRVNFARVMWDLHSAVGFWVFFFVLMWAVSGAYLVYQDQLASASWLDPAAALASWLTELHFGRFDWLTRFAWSLIGLTPAVLAFTGAFICCRRVLFHKPSNPKHPTR